MRNRQNFSERRRNCSEQKNNATSRIDHRSKFSNLSSWKEAAWKKKNQGFNGIRTRDLRDTGAMLYQLSYEATNWERGQLYELTSSREEWKISTQQIIIIIIVAVVAVIIIIIIIIIVISNGNRTEWSTI